MKKIVYLCAIVFALMSCEQLSNDGISGRWKSHQDGKYGFGAIDSELCFRNGTYTSDCWDDGKHVGHSSGKYMYIGEESGELYMYDRVECGYEFSDTVRCHVELRNGSMYLTSYGATTEYKR
jgi:hypothetical protein